MKYIKILLPFFLALPSFAAEIHRLPPESRTDLSFSFGKDTSVEFKTGKDKEGFAFSKVGDNDISCRFTDANGKSKNIPYRTNGLTRRNFAWSDPLLGWSSVYEKIFAKDLSVSPQAVTLENRKGETVVFLNGMALNAVSAMETIVLPEKRNVSWKESVPLKESGFRMIDIGQRFNASGDLEIPENKEMNVGGIPFRFSSKAELNHIDLSMSWFREGMLTIYEEPQTGSFG